MSLTLLLQPAAAEAVELELVLAIDVSASVNDEEYALQRLGTAKAFRDPAVQQAVAAAPGGIAVTVFHWASRGYQAVAIPWTQLQSRESLDAFADEVARMPRRVSGGGTAIHAALAFGHRLFGDSPVRGRRRVIDLAGNGEANQLSKTLEMRDRIVADGVVINGLAIEELKADLTAYFRDSVIGGPGAFVETAWDFDDFSRAMRLKLLREIGDRRISQAVPQQVPQQSAAAGPAAGPAAAPE